MERARSVALVIAALLPLRMADAERAVAKRAPETGTVRFVMDSGEADAVLSILQKERSGRALEPADWERLFATAGYQRLEARETAMKRPFTRADFERFVRSPQLVSRAEILGETVARWKTLDVSRAARLALAYLPPGARIEAILFPVIKPQPNSFVFDQPSPAIFASVDPDVAPQKLENMLAHELHHIGFASACPTLAEREKNRSLPQAMRQAIDWLGAFGEGFAMLAAAGGIDIHPHAVSKPEDRARWDRDMKNTDRDLETLDRFFRDVLEGHLTREQVDKRAFTFFGVQGPWYTVGYLMAATIEQALGREQMIDCFCDVRRLPAAYNQAADKLHRGRARWSRRLLLELAGPRRAS